MRPRGRVRPLDKSATLSVRNHAEFDPVLTSAPKSLSLSNDRNGILKHRPGYCSATETPSSVPRVAPFVLVRFGHAFIAPARARKSQGAFMPTRQLGNIPRH